MVRALKRRGIQSLFPIQTMVLRPAMEGKDLTARAKTGSGKTLAFALPVVESLLAEDQDRKARKAPGRTPRCDRGSSSRAAGSSRVGGWLAGGPDDTKAKQSSGGCLRRPVSRGLGSHGAVVFSLFAYLTGFPSVLMSGVCVVLCCLTGACRCLILAPTRELAKQVAAEFESICPSLTVVSFYGGTSINAQVRGHS